MLYFYTGNDGERLRIELGKALAARKSEAVRITDAHAVHDLSAALEGGGLFASGKRTVVLENTLTNADMSEIVLGRLKSLKEADDDFYIIESTPDAMTKKLVSKYAESTEKFELVKEKKAETVFALANALQSGKKKDLWVGYRREIAAGKSPESIHGVLFWAAKQQMLRTPADARARRLVARLAELPHEARRSGADLEYALEHFVLTSA
ncbi:hypothetical protein K8R03_03920 [Candidatus Kaiserbacteria bacterium]|nr:hypothetical protein [Candidatus Kaiserbacteria bacterium]